MIFNNYGKQSKGKYANINKNNTVSIGKNINTKQNTVKSTPLPAGSVRHPTSPWPSRNSKMTRTVPSAANKSSPVDASKNRERAGKGLSSEINLPEETRLSTNINKEKTGNNKFGNLAEAISIIGKPAENKITNTMSNTKEKKNGLLEGVLEKGKEGVDWLKGKGEKVKEGGQELFANILEKGKEGVDRLKEKGEKVKEGGQELFANILEKGKEGVDWLNEKGENVKEGAKELFGSILEKGKTGMDWLKEKGGKAKEGLNAFLETSLKKGKEGVDWLKEKGKKAAGGFFDKINDVFKERNVKETGGSNFLAMANGISAQPMLANQTKSEVALLSAVAADPTTTMTFLEWLAMCVGVSQLDSPAIGPADVVAGVLLLGGAIYFGAQAIGNWVSSSSSSMEEEKTGESSETEEKTGEKSGDDIDSKDVDIDNLPEGWTKTENNGFIHIRDENGNIRIRIDPPDSKTNYPHKHLYDSNGNPIDAGGNPVNPKSPDAHIPFN